MLEVGAGLGTLTVELAQRAGRVLAVETDPALIEVLAQELAAWNNIELIHGDILQLDPASLLKACTDGSPALPLWGTRLPHYYVVANLPYYVTAAVLRHLLEATVRPARLVLTVQLEVAQRIVAGPGDMSLLSVSAQFYGAPKIGMRLKRGAFYPAPAVDSAVVLLDTYDAPPVPVDDVAAFFRVVRAGFAQKRKQLRNTLATSLGLAPTAVGELLAQAGLDAMRRAETLTLHEWGTVFAALRPALPNPD